MFGESRTRQFERVVLPHLSAAHNLARWLLRNEQDAEDVVQEACLRAFRHLDRLHSQEGRAWLLVIVRNESYDWLQRRRARELTLSLEEQAGEIPSDTYNPEHLVMQSVDSERMREALEALPLEFREVIVLRELEELSYKEIADIVNAPIGTVMSRLARARKRLQEMLTCRPVEEV